MLYFTHKFLLFSSMTIIPCVIFHTHSCCSLSHGGVPHRFILFDFETTLHCPMRGISHKSLLFAVMTMMLCWIISCGSCCVFLFGCKEPVIPVIKVLIPSHSVHQLRPHSIRTHFNRTTPNMHTQKHFFLLLPGNPFVEAADQTAERRYRRWSAWLVTGGASQLCHCLEREITLKIWACFVLLLKPPHPSEPFLCFDLI